MRKIEQKPATSSKKSRQRVCKSFINMHDFTWRGQGYIFLLSPPPPDLVVHVRAPLLAYVSRGVGGVQLADFTWCMGAWLPPHPSIVSRTRATLCKYNFQFSIIISNLNVKSEFQTAERHVGDVQNHITGISKCNLFQTLYHWNLFQRHLPHRYYVCVHN